MDKKKSDSELNNDLSSTELDDIYGENDELLGDIDLEDDVEVDISDDEVGETDLDFVEDDIEEIYSDEPDEVVEAAEDDFQDYQNPPVKKKSSFGMVAVLLLLIGGGGAGAYFSGMIPGVGPSSSGGRSYQAPAAVDTTEEQNVAATETEETTVDNQVEEPVQETAESLQNLYDEDYDEFSQYDEEAQVSETTQDAGFLEGDAFDFDNQEEPTNATEELFADEQEPQEQETVIAEMVSPVVADTQEQLTDVAVPPETAINSDEIDQMDGKISSLETRLEQLQSNLENRFSNIQSSIDSIPQGGDASAVASAPAKVDLSGIESEISEVRQSVSSLNSRLDQFESKLNSSIQKLESAMAAQPKSEPKADAAPTPAPAPKKPAAAAPAKPAAPSVTASSWEIRAIQVGKAVIARKGTGETRDIQVGDSVPGLGTVGDINYKNGGWVIEGSGGTIKQ